jgi:hypothetical protein
MILEDITLICSTIAGLGLAWIAAEFFIGKYRSRKKKSVKGQA